MVASPFLFAQPTVEQIDSVYSFTDADIFGEYFIELLKTYPDNMIVSVQQYIHEINMKMPNMNMIDFKTLADMACKNYQEIDELFSLDDYMTTELYVPLYNDFVSVGFRNAAAEAQRITDEVTIQVRIFLQDLDNLLTGLSIPHISGFGSVWRPSIITPLGYMQLSRVPMSQIRAELGV